MLELDRRLFILLNERLHNSALDWLMPHITNLHQSIGFWIVMLIWAGWLVARGGRRGRVVVVLLIVLMPGSDLLSTYGAKAFFSRPRPSALVHSAVTPITVAPIAPVTMVPGDRLLQKRLTSSSFPSSHATTMATLATILIWAYRRKTRWAWTALLLPLLVGWSRVYVGVHYPLDVVGGWILGTLIGMAGCALAARWEAAASKQPREEALAPSWP